MLRECRGYGIPDAAPHEAHTDSQSLITEDDSNVFSALLVLVQEGLGGFVHDFVLLFKI